MSYKVIGNDSDLSQIIKKSNNAFISIGQIKNSSIRREKISVLKSFGYKIPSFVSKFAYVSKYNRIGNGTIIMHGSIVNTNVIIGENCIVNSKALIEHDVNIGSNTHISTGAIINGGSCIGEKLFYREWCNCLP